MRAVGAHTRVTCLPSHFFVRHAILSYEPPQLRRHPGKQGRKPKGDVAGAEAKGKDGMHVIENVSRCPWHPPLEKK